MTPDAANPFRDPRLDVARGLAMFIILVAHIPSNGWAEWIPARFGFSDATEIFVFCSGVASAYAYGRVFDRFGMGAGTIKIAARIRLVYAVHVVVFAAIVATISVADSTLATGDLLRGRLGLAPLLDDPLGRVPQFLALIYVPNAFDILPMYLGVLALVPVMMFAARRGLALVAGLSVGLWLLAGLNVLELPADLASGRPWFFNPFGWQLLFFLGFGFARGWLRPPAATPFTLGAALAVLALCAPFSCHAGWSCHAAWGMAPWLGEAHAALLPFADKTSLGPLRILHFLALAFVAYSFAGEHGRRIAGPVADLFRTVGRQTLSAFLAGLWLAQVLGVLLDLVGRNPLTLLLANVLGCVALVLVAVTVERIKRGWRGDARRSLTPGSEASAPTNA